jgi:hypothetical protein
LTVGLELPRPLTRSRATPARLHADHAPQIFHPLSASR